MKNKIITIISSITNAKWWVDKLFWKPTDIIWFWEFWLELANALEPYVTKKEICYFDEKIKNNTDYHYLDFTDMLEKTELMIFTCEIDISYLNNISKLNRWVLIVVDSSFSQLIAKFKELWFSDNLLILKY